MESICLGRFPRCLPRCDFGIFIGGASNFIVLRGFYVSGQPALRFNGLILNLFLFDWCRHAICLFTMCGMACEWSLMHVKVFRTIETKNGLL